MFPTSRPILVGIMISSCVHNFIVLGHILFDHTLYLCFLFIYVWKYEELVHFKILLSSTSVWIKFNFCYLGNCKIYLKMQILLTRVRYFLIRHLRYTYSYIHKCVYIKLCLYWFLYVFKSLSINWLMSVIYILTLWMKVLSLHQFCQFTEEQNSRETEKEKARRRTLNSSMVQEALYDFTNDPEVVYNMDALKQKAIKRRKELEA